MKITVITIFPEFFASFTSTSIIKRAKAQKKNPYKQEIFTDQRDFREAMERA